MMKANNIEGLIYYIRDNILLLVFIFSIGLLIGAYSQALEDVKYIQELMFDSATTNELINDGNFIYHISLINSSEYNRLSGNYPIDISNITLVTP